MTHKNGYVRCNLMIYTIHDKESWLNDRRVGNCGSNGQIEHIFKILAIPMGICLHHIYNM